MHLRCYFFGLFLYTVPLAAQPFTFLQFSLSEGLSQSQVYAVCQDHRDYLWLGTQGGGVCRFDGAQFEPIHSEDGLPSDYVNSICANAFGQVIVGTNKGCAIIDAQKQVKVLSGYSGPVYALNSDAHARTLVGTPKGVLIVREGVNRLEPFVPFAALANLSVETFANGKRGVWAGTSKGLWLLGTQSQKAEAFLPLSGQAVKALKSGPAGKLWVAVSGALLLIDEQLMEVVGTYTHVALEQSQSMAIAGDGKIWVGTANNGLFIFSPENGLWSSFSEQQGLPHNNIRALIADRRGQIWAGTSGEGLLRFLAQNFQHYSKENGLGGDRIYAVLQTAEGKILVSASQNGLFQLDSNGIQAIQSDSGYLRVKCKTIATDRWDRVWVGTDGKGIAVLDTPRMRVVGTENGFSGNWIQKIIRDPNGDMFVAVVSGGIYRVSCPDPLRFIVKKIIFPDQFKNINVSTLALDPGGRLWFATLEGLIGRVKNDRMEILFGSETGLPSVQIRCLAFNAAGSVYAGTKGEGIYWADPSGQTVNFQPLRLSRPSSRNIYLLQFDQAGHLWVGTEIGVDRLSIDIPKKIAEVEHFGRNEGFLGVENCQDAVLLDHSGQIWFGTMNGLVRYLPGDHKRNVLAPKLYFTNVSLFYKPLSETQYAEWLSVTGGLEPGMDLPWNQNHLSFAFHAVDLSNPDKMRYRWRLEGAELEWSPWSDQRQVNYANLAPGSYCFYAQAMSADGAMSAPEAAYFTILKPFWQHWPFQLAIVLALLTLLVWIGWRWVNGVKKAEKARREQLEVQNKLLQLEQKALQLQMNPHFIFNALNSIQSMISTKDFPTARLEIQAFARLMRAVLSNSRKASISLQEEQDTLEQYLKIEQFCQQNKFQYHISTSTALDLNEMEIPPMLLQPFVENAVIHGVSHLSYPGQINIHFDLDGQLLRCTIEDNGVGREKSALLRQARKPGHQSTALQVTKERLEAMQGAAVYNALEISDVMNEQKNIAGTRVVVRMPLIMNF
jgi:ligand-binding sensor domain-containing protein/anti-sigma regulatory factor (Ser/Thr protein kinase)